MQARTHTILTVVATAMLITALTALVPVAGRADDITVSRDDFQKLMEKIETLTEQNKTLSTRVQALESGAAIPDGAAITQRIEALEKREPASDSDIALLNEDVEQLSEILEVVERKTLVDTLEWSGELRTRADWYSYRGQYNDDTGAKVREKDKVKGLISNRFRLNITSKISDDLQFHGRLTMFKNWNDSNYGNYGQSAESREPTDSSLFVERAYVDYFFQLHEKLPMALTFGRLPMADGLPTNLRDDRPRQSIFPSLAYDVVSDGVGLSIMLDELTGLKDSAFRYIYSRTVADDDVYPYRDYQINIDEQDSHIFQLESMLPGRYGQDILAMATVVWSPDIATPDLSRINPLLSTDGRQPGSVGSYKSLTLFAMAERYLGSNFDWFAGFSYSQLNPENTVNWNITIPGVGTFPAASYRLADRKVSGHAWYLGFRYTIPYEPLNNPKFGYEYNEGSKYFFTFSMASEDPLNKLNLNGKCHDFYYIQPITKHLMLRTGMTFLKRDYPDMLIRSTSNSSGYKETIYNPYFLLDARF